MLQVRYLAAVVCLDYRRLDLRLHVIRPLLVATLSSWLLLARLTAG